MKVTYGKQFTLPRPERSGYTFVGWKLNGATVDGGICTITADCTLVAEWKAISYSITYHLDGGTNHKDNPADYTVEDTVTLKDPSCVGYKFLGWTYNGMSTPTKNPVITGDLVGVREFTAVWEVAKSKVTLNAGGGQHSIRELDVTYGDDMDLGGTPTWAGHKFLGWYVDGDRSKPVTSGICRLERDTELVALWEYEQYTISYNLDGGTNHADNPDVFTCDDTVVLRTPTKKGYVFAGWLVDGQGSPVMDVTIGKGTMVNQSYTAKWEAVKTTVTLDAGEGTVSQGTYGAEYGEDYALPTPTRTGYRFLGWMLGGEDIPSEGVWNREDTALTLQAKWEAKVYTITLQNIRDYTCVVTLNANYVGGETTSKIFPASDPMDYPLPAEREGYVFAGWYTDVACSDGNLFDFTQNLTAGITLYAKWVEVADYCGGTIPLNGDSEEFSLALGEENLYAFVSPKDGFVTVYTQHHDGGDPYLQLYDENMNRLDGMHDDDHGDSDAEVTWEVDGGHVYYVGVGSYSSGIGSIHLDLGYEIDGGRVGIDGKEGFHYELGQTVTVQIQYDELLDWGIPQYEDATFVGWRDIETQQMLQNGSAWTLDADSRLEAVWQ